MREKIRHATENRLPALFLPLGSAASMLAVPFALQWVSEHLWIRTSDPDWYPAHAYGHQRCGQCPAGGHVTGLFQCHV